MKKDNLLTKSIFPFLLLMVVGFIFLANYKPGSYLMGWDSLQTELNPLLAVKRATHASWQEYQSFGLTSGMAHAADIVRAVFLFIVNVIIPSSIIRYFFHFLMLYIGSLGFFFLLEYLGFKKEKKVLAFIGACFYILNLGTIQIFNLPFEPFSVLFAFLPWEIYVFLRFAYAKRLTPVLIFSLVAVNILATPQAYLQTLFVVYIMCLVFLSFGMFFENEDNRKLIRRFVVAFGLIVLVNLFWILPQAYFLKTSLSVVKESKINQLATDIVSRQNIEKGTLKSFARMEGFYFDLYDTNDQLIFGPWHAHFDNFFVNLLTYVPFILVVMGVFRKSRSHYGFVSIMVLIGMMLLSNIKALSFFNSAIFSHSFVNQVFRSPFTKFVVPFSLVYSYLFVSGLVVAQNHIFKRLPQKENLDEQRGKSLESVIFAAVVMLMLIVYSLPSFLGHYFAGIMRVGLPRPYLEVINYFDEQDKNKRVAFLPDYTFWGWFSHKWGYDGSGFLWYGIEQPMVSRTFDVWSLSSESYFWEIKYAIESINPVLFEQVLTKYNIDYLVLDKTLRPVSSIEEGLQYDQIDRILEQTDKVVRVENFGDLEILKVVHDHNIESFVSVVEKMPTVGPKIKLTNKDQAFIDLGTYRSSDQPDYIYPFLDFTTQTEVQNSRWSISEEGDYFVFKAYLGDIDLSQYDMAENIGTTQAKVFLGEDIENYEYQIDQYLDGGLLVTKVKKELIETFDPTYVEINNCRDSGSFGVMKRGSTLAIESEDRGMACFGYASGLMDHWNGYLVKVDSENIAGKELFFYIFGNRTRRQSKLEVNLKGGVEYFAINPGHYFDDGYFFSFQNPSYESIPSENKLKTLEVYLMPFEYLKNVKLVKKGVEETPKAKFTGTFNVEKENYYVYKLNETGHQGKDLILYQAYDPGWKAYVVKKGSLVQENMPFYFAREVKDHFKVNNWANGWTIPEIKEGEFMLIFFWPQMLEYAGIITLVVVWNFAILGAFVRLRVLEKAQEKLNL